MGQDVDSPLVQGELQQAKMYLLGEISGLNEAKVAALLAKGHAIVTLNDTTLQSLVAAKDLKDREARELGLTVNLYLLFDENVKLTETVKKGRLTKLGGRKLSSLRDLAAFDSADWLAILRKARVELPEDITREAYADVLSHRVAALYPTDAFFTRIAPVDVVDLTSEIERVAPLFDGNSLVFSAPGLDLISADTLELSETKGLHTIFKRFLRLDHLDPELNNRSSLRNDPLLASITREGRLKELSELSDKNIEVIGTSIFHRLNAAGLEKPEIDTIRTAHAKLMRLVNIYPGLDLGEILDDPKLTPVDKASSIKERIGWLNRVREQNSNVEFLKLDYSPDTEDVAALNFKGLSEAEQAGVKSALKSYQRVYFLTKDVGHVRTVMEAGYRSATGIVNAGIEAFIRSTGLDEEVAGRYYDTARGLTVTVGAGVGAILDYTRGGFNLLNVSNIKPRSMKTNDGETLNRLDDFEALFGNQTFCQCSHCQSIFSPAAYFVDLMHFLETNLPAAIPRLKACRPDLWKVELTCENTNTEIPTLNVVNKILENYIFREIFAPLLSFVLILTDASFQALQNCGVPDAEVLQPLTDLKGKKFTTGNAFLSEVKKRIQAQYIVLYGALLVKYALSLECFMLTADSLQRLRTENVPDSVLNSLQSLENQKYCLKVTFLQAVEGLIGAQNTNAYKGRILEHAFYPVNYPDLTVMEEMIVYQAIKEFSRFLGSFRRPLVLPIEKLQSYLAHFDLTRAKIARALEAVPAVLARTTLNLSLEEYSLITQAKTDLEFLSGLYCNILTLESGDRIKAFDVQDILHPMGLSRSDLGELIKTRFVDSGIRIEAGKRDPQSSVQNDIEFIDNLTLDALDRMHRFTRLWRRLTPMESVPDGPRWTMAELDLTLFLLGSAGSPSRSIDLEKLATVVSIQERWGITVAETCGLWSDNLKDICLAGQKATTSLLDRLFNLPSFGQADNPFPRDHSLFVHPAFLQPGDPGPSDDALNRLHTGLQINDEELYQLIVRLDKALGLDLTATKPVIGFYLTAQNITLLYRHARLAKLMKLSIPELFQCIEFAISNSAFGSNLENLTGLAKLLEFYDWWQTSGYKLDDLGFITGGKILKPEAYPNAPNIVEQMLVKIQADKALEFADTVFAFLEGLTEEQSRQIISANSAPEADLVEAVNPEKTIYRLAGTFGSSTVPAIPDDVARAVAQAKNIPMADAVLLLETKTRAVFLKYHAGEVIPARLAALLNFSVDKLKSLIALAGKNPYYPVFAMALQGDAISVNQLVELVDKVLRLSTLFRKEIFNPDTLDFINKHKNNVFSISDFNSVTTEQVRKLSVYKALADSAAGAGSSSDNEPVFSSTDVSQVLWGLAKGLPLPSTEQGDLARSLAKVLQVDIGFATTLMNSIPLPQTAPEALMKLARCAALARLLGVGGATPKYIISDDYEELSLAGDAVLGALRSKYPEEKDWQGQVAPIEDKLLSRKRDALCDFLLQLGQLGFIEQDMKTMHDLYHYFLIDAELEGCARTSLVVAAISSVQLYIQRILMNLESVTLTPKMAKEWEWRKNYRVWEANRKVFLYPENYIEPDLRDDKTPLFIELESKLLQQEITQQNVLDAYSAYLSGFEQVARLKIAGSYHDIKSYLVKEDTLHLFGVTQDDPPVYYYRAVNYAYWGEKPDTHGIKRGIDWSHWRKVDVQIPVRKVAPVVYNGRLYVFWVEFTTTPKNEVSDGKSRFVGYRHKMTLKYTTLQLDGTWTAPQVISLKIPSIFMTGEGIIEDRLVNPDEQQKFSQLMQDLTMAVVTSDVAKIKEAHDRLINLQKDMSCPQFDTIPHFEPKDGYTLTGFKWDQIYPSVMDQDLIVTGRNFILRSAIDFYQKAVVPTSQPKLTPSIDLLMINSVLLPNGSMRQLRYMSPRWPFDDYASCSLLLYWENRYKLDDEIWGHVDLNQYFSAPPQVRAVIANLSPAAELAVINGSSVAVSPYRFNPSLQDCIIDFQGDLFLLQGSVRIPSYCLLKRIGTTLSEKITRKLFKGGVDALLDIGTQKEDLHETNPLTMNPPTLIVNNDCVEIDKWTDQNMDQGQQFDFKHGPYGVYYREIFFHIPFLIANHLNSQGRFADAQRWYHYIFDPTASEITNPPQDRNWRYLEFRNPCPTLREILTDEETIEVYKKDPFNPHAIARLRLSAYQKSIVMKYIDNLLDWADSLFARYTRESVNEATLLYVMAADILGKRPAELGECGEGGLKPRNYDTIRPLINGEDSEFLQEFTAEMETRALSKTYIGDSKSKLAYTFALEETVMASAAKSADLSAVAGRESGTVSGGIFKAYDWKKTPVGSGSKQPGVQDSPLIQDPELISDFSVSLIRTVCCGSELITHKPEMALRPIFCIPVNKDLLGYWDRVEDRLYKIRHCLDINGVRRDLALFAPEIDPYLLVQMKAAGLTLEDVLGAASGNLPPYRFTYLIEKAKQYAGVVQSFGSALLSALEKKDIEQLNKMRTVHEQNILKLTRQIKQWEIDAETESLQALQRQQESVAYRKEYYQGLIDQGLTSWERTEQVARHASAGLRVSAATFDTVAAIMYLAPQFGSPFSMKYGGKELGDSGVTWSELFRTIAEISDSISASAGLEATFERREQEWKHQLELADRELKQLERQLAAAKIRQQIANRSLDIHDKNIEQAKEIYDFYADKFTSFGLYTWLSTNLQALYRDAYNSAFAMARLAEQAYRFERDEDSAVLLEPGYWEASRAGLLAGERLLIALQNMERKYIETNYRGFEIEQSFSLAQINPEAMVQIKETGVCVFEIPEMFFDLYYPGQYRRMIKSVRISIPCITGPFTNVGATLKLTGSQLRAEPNINAALQEVPLQRSVCIATSKAQNDAGVFELNFHDERYMPFEGAGAVGKWKLELPKLLRSFDYGTISDIILHISYTARDGGETFKNDVENKLVDNLTQNEIYRLLSLKHDFPNVYHQLLHPAGATPTVEFKLGKEYFPYFLSEKKLNLSNLRIYLKPMGKDPVATTGLTFSVGLVDNSSNTIINSGTVSNWSNQVGNLRTGSISLSGDPINKWKIGTVSGILDTEKLEDILILLTYSVSAS